MPAPTLEFSVAGQFFSVRVVRELRLGQVLAVSRLVRRVGRVRSRIRARRGSFPADRARSIRHGRGSRDRDRLAWVDRADRVRDLGLERDRDLERRGRADLGCLRADRRHRARLHARRGRLGLRAGADASSIPRRRKAR